MAQQFVLKGVKDLRDYSSSDNTFTFRINQDARGGDQHQIPKWWNRKANNVVYESCTVFDMVGTNYKMIIPTSVDTQLQVTYDGDIYNMIFSNFSAVDRILFTDVSTKKPVIEYLLPSISGGAIAKRILQSASTIGTFTITGKGTVDVGQSTQYQSNATPNTSDAVYAWTVEQGGSVVATSVAEITAGASSSGCTVNWKAAGSFDVKCAITSETATDSPQSDSRAVTCSVVPSVGTVAVSGNATPAAQTSSTYTATVSGNNVNDLEYAWSVVDAAANVANPSGTSTAITFEAAGNATVQCIVSSAALASDTTSDTENVVVSTAKSIGAVTINGDAAVGTGVASNYQASTPESNVADMTYAWTVSPSSGVVIAASGAQATNITFGNANSYEVKCVVSSVIANPGSKTGTAQVVATASSTIGNVTVSGASLVDTLNIGKQYTAAISGDAATPEFTWSATPSVGAVFANNKANPVSVTFTAENTYTIKCQVTDGGATDSPESGSKIVNVEL